MVAVKHYDIKISSSGGELLLERTVTDNVTTFMLDYMDDHSEILLKINITVVDINGQRSEASVVERSISDMPDIISSTYINCVKLDNYMCIISHCPLTQNILGQKVME